MMKACKQICIWRGVGAYQIGIKMDGDSFEHFVVPVIVSYQMQIMVGQKHESAEGNIIFLPVNEHGNIVIQNQQHFVFRM